MFYELIAGVSSGGKGAFPQPGVGPVSATTRNGRRMDYEQIANASINPDLNRLHPAPYIVIDTVVLPGTRELLDALGVLVQLSERVRSARNSNDEYFRGELFPLEGEWEADAAYEVLDFDAGITGTIMMRQPDSLTPTEFEEHKRGLAQATGFVQHGYLECARLAIVDEGLCVQMRHFGPYHDEPASFAAMERYLEEHNLLRKHERIHREIYFVDARTASPEAYETVLRVEVEDRGHDSSLNPNAG